MDSGGEPMRLNIKSPNIVTSIDYMTQAEALEPLSELFSFVLGSLPRVAGKGLTRSLIDFCAKGQPPSKSSASSELICFSEVDFTARFELMLKGPKLNIWKHSHRNMGYLSR